MAKSLLSEAISGPTYQVLKKVKKKTHKSANKC